MRWMILLLLAAPAHAESLVAARTIRALSVVGPEDLVMAAAALPGALTDPAEALGLEARVTIYPGRAIRPGDLGPPATVERNQIVPIAYRMGALAILAEGRALARGGPGEVIRVMNMDSKVTVTGRLGPDGVVNVGPGN